MNCRRYCLFSINGRLYLHGCHFGWPRIPDARADSKTCVFYVVIFTAVEEFLYFDTECLSNNNNAKNVLAVSIIFTTPFLSYTSFLLLRSNLPPAVARFKSCKCQSVLCIFHRGRSDVRTIRNLRLNNSACPSSNLIIGTGGCSVGRIWRQEVLGLYR